VPARATTAPEPDRAGRTAPADEAVFDRLATTDVVEDDGEAERARVVRAAVTTLPPRDRALLGLLAADPPLSYDEIAAALDMPRGSIGPTRARCLDRLRRSLGAAAG